MHQIRPFVIKATQITSAVILGLFLTIAALPAQASVAEAEQKADALIAYQLPDGGVLVDRPDNQPARLVPYFSNLAALGWTETAKVTTDTARRQKYLKATRNWLNWYANHQNSDGTIYDFEGPVSDLKPTGSYDSTDSYPATYALLMWRFFDVTQDTVFLQEKLSSLNGAYSAMFLTRDAEGMTFARPGSYYRYLMDNCEVAAGLVAFEKLYSALGESARASDARTALDILKTRFVNLYRSKDGYFGYALDPFGNVSGRFTKGYPDAMANLFALIFLAPSSPEAAALLDKVKTSFWGKPDASDFPHWWVWAAMVCNDKELEEFALAQLKSLTAKSNADSFIVGMTAAIMSTGLESIRFPEAVCTWKQITVPSPSQAILPTNQELAGPDSSLYFTSRYSTASIAGGGWRAVPLSLPAAVDFEITSATGYLLMNLVWTPSLNLTGIKGLSINFTAPDEEVLQFKLRLVEEDGNTWDAKIPKTKPGENDMTIKLNDLLRTSGKETAGNGKFSSVRGLRLQFDNAVNRPVRGQLRLNRISAVQTSDN